MTMPTPPPTRAGTRALLAAALLATIAAAAAGRLGSSPAGRSRYSPLAVQHGHSPVLLRRAEAIPGGRESMWTRRIEKAVCLRGGSSVEEAEAGEGGDEEEEEGEEEGGGEGVEEEVEDERGSTEEEAIDEDEDNAEIEEVQAADNSSVDDDEDQQDNDDDDNDGDDQEEEQEEHTSAPDGHTTSEEDGDVHEPSDPKAPLFSFPSSPTSLSSYLEDALPPQQRVVKYFTDDKIFGMRCAATCVALFGMVCCMAPPTAASAGDGVAPGAGGGGR